MNDDWERTPDEARARLGFAAAGIAVVAILAAAAAGLAGRGMFGPHDPAMAAHAQTPAAASAPAVPSLDPAKTAAPLAALYRYATANEAEFTQVPCWCGCQTFLGHRNLYDCYQRRDGAGWEAHAAGCGVCQGEAHAAQQMLDAGSSPADVTARVNADYGPTVSTVPPNPTA